MTTETSSTAATFAAECPSYHDATPAWWERVRAVATVESEDGATVHTFEDGSAIVEVDGAWDVRPEECAAHCWEGAGCTCGASYEVADSGTADTLDGEPSDDLIEASLDAGAEGHVYAVLAEGAWQVAAQSDAGAIRVYVREV